MLCLARCKEQAHFVILSGTGRLRIPHKEMLGSLHICWETCNAASYELGVRKARRVPRQVCAARTCDLLDLTVLSICFGQRCIELLSSSQCRPLEFGKLDLFWQLCSAWKTSFNLLLGVVKTEHLIFEYKWTHDPECSLWAGCYLNCCTINVDMCRPFR